MPAPVRLKKYANRRLYNTEKSAYVTLNEVAELIKQGRQVEVVDASTDEDVTGFVLVQVIQEISRKKNPLLPVPLLHLIIQYGESVLDEFFEKYLQKTIESYLAYKRAMDEQFERWLGLGTEFSEMSQQAMSSMQSMQALFDFFPGPKARQEDDQQSDDGDT
jgi:polyhydroxyalkanoate synthesis repressor PhaR